MRKLIYIAFIVGLSTCSYSHAGLITKIGNSIGKLFERESGKKTAERTVRAGMARGAARLSRADAIKALGSVPVERMGRLLGKEVLRSESMLVAHNPEKEQIWKALADCAEAEMKGIKAETLISASVMSKGELVKLNIRSMREMYRYARMYGLSTPSNMQRMHAGLAPVFPDGNVAHLDHIVPVMYAPELKSIPANIRILSSTENVTRRATIDRHCINKIRELSRHTDWKPSAGLRNAVEASKYHL